MNTNFKRTISIVTAVLMLITVFVIPVGPVYAAKDDDDIAWTEGIVGGAIYFDEATGTITDCDQSVTEAVIPEEINGVTVREISGKAFDGYYDDYTDEWVSHSLESVTIPDTIVYMPDTVFNDCMNLKEIKAHALIDGKNKYSENYAELEYNYFVYDGMLYESHKMDEIKEDAKENGYEVGYLLEIFPICLPNNDSRTDFRFPDYTQISLLEEQTSEANDCYYSIWNFSQVNLNAFKNCKNLTSITFNQNTTFKASYVKVRAYKTYGGKTQYGQWSKYKKIKCK